MAFIFDTCRHLRALQTSPPGTATSAHDVFYLSGNSSLYSLHKFATSICHLDTPVATRCSQHRAPSVVSVIFHVKFLSPATSPHVTKGTMIWFFFSVVRNVTIIFIDLALTFVFQILDEWIHFQAALLHLWRRFPAPSVYCRGSSEGERALHSAFAQGVCAYSQARRKCVI